MTANQFNKIKTDVNKLLEGGKIRGLNLSLYDIREIVYVLNNLNSKPEFINSNVKKFCDKYKIDTAICGIGWKII